MTTMPDLNLAVRTMVDGGLASTAITMERAIDCRFERKDGPLWQARPPRMKAISAGGIWRCATLAGFAHAAAQGVSGEEAVRLATACGAANCVAPAPGRIELATVEALVPQIEVQQLSLGMN